MAAALRPKNLAAGSRNLGKPCPGSPCPEKHWPGSPSYPETPWPGSPCPEPCRGSPFPGNPYQEPCRGSPFSENPLPRNPLHQRQHHFPRIRK